jgi:SAM-dependent methyltransferase
MPYSSKEGKPQIQEWFASRYDIWRVLDIGCGAATYPKLLGKSSYLWTGIEIWEPYIKEFDLYNWYENLIVADFMPYLGLLPADCVIFGDVLEHVSREVAVEAIRIADEKYKHVVISIPIEYPQEATENPFEEHKYVWNMAEINNVVPASFQVRGLSWDIAIFIK